MTIPQTSSCSNRGNIASVVGFEDRDRDDVRLVFFVGDAAGGVDAVVLALVGEAADLLLALGVVPLSLFRFRFSFFLFFKLSVGSAGENMLMSNASVPLILP